ncbi:MAG: hypothetical protein KGH53_02515 [Candidatus Micrarchaeota archaeon]|nr:hypothetical protein [Candidatus Micrarchaeota archaeon]
MEVINSSKGTSNYRTSSKKLEELQHARYAIAQAIISHLENFVRKDPKLKMDGKFGAMEKVIEFRRLTKQILEIDKELEHSNRAPGEIIIYSDHIVHMSGVEKVAFAGIFRIRGKFAFVKIEYATDSNIEVKDSKSEVVEFLHKKKFIDKAKIDGRLEDMVKSQLGNIRVMKKELEEGKNDLIELKKKIELKEEKWLYRSQHK